MYLCDNLLSLKKVKPEVIDSIDLFKFLFINFVALLPTIAFDTEKYNGMKIYLLLSFVSFDN